MIVGGTSQRKRLLDIWRSYCGGPIVEALTYNSHVTLCLMGKQHIIINTNFVSFIFAYQTVIVAYNMR